MKFEETKLPGSFVIEPERHVDERGFFARVWCKRELATHHLDAEIVQCNISFNEKSGTLRGMHYQADPHAEIKLIRCTRGAIFDVIADLRPDSTTYKQHVSVILTGENRKVLYVPKGFAHGFQTLEDNTEVFYQMSEYYSPSAARGFRWDDPVFQIAWPPAEKRTISPRDLAYPDFTSV